MAIQLPSRKGAQPPNFRPMSIVAKRSPISATAEHLYKRSPKTKFSTPHNFVNFIIYITPCNIDPVPVLLRTVSVRSQNVNKISLQLECGLTPNVMAALPNIGGALCSTPQSLADAHY